MKNFLADFLMTEPDSEYEPNYNTSSAYDILKFQIQRDGIFEMSWNDGQGFHYRDDGSGRSRGLIPHVYLQLYLTAEEGQLYDNSDFFRVDFKSYSFNNRFGSGILHYKADVEYHFNTRFKKVSVEWRDFDMDVIQYLEDKFGVLLMDKLPMIENG